MKPVKVKYWKYAGNYYRLVPGKDLERFSNGAGRWVRSVTGVEVLVREGSEITPGDKRIPA